MESFVCVYLVVRENLLHLFIFRLHSIFPFPGRVCIGVVYEFAFEFI